MNRYDQTVAYQLYTSIKNSGVLEDSLKARFGDDYTDDLKSFEETFQSDMGTQLIFDANVNNGLYQGMKAYWLQNYQASGGDETRATQATVKFFTDKLFNTIEISGEDYLIPKHFDANKIKNTYEDIFENPQRYGIFTDSTFTIDDFSDNADSYRPVIKGNTVYIQQADGGQVTARIYQKLPSGKNDYVLSTVGFKSTNQGAETYAKDVESTWEYDKSSNFNTDLDSLLAPRFKSIKGKVNRKIKYDPTSDPDEAAEELRKLFYIQEVKADGTIEYLDVFAGELTTNSTEQQTLNAISYYIKDGTMTPWVLDYLADNFDFLSDLENDAIKQQILNEWNTDNIQKYIKTTSSDTPITMSPLASLTDLIKATKQNLIETRQVVDQALEFTGTMSIMGSDAPFVP
jgi:hypothetical protein